MSNAKMNLLTLIHYRHLLTQNQQVTMKTITTIMIMAMSKNKMIMMMKRVRVRKILLVRAQLFKI